MKGATVVSVARFLAVSVGAWACSSIAGPPVPTSIVRDGSVGPSIATQPAGVSGVYTIPQTHGLSSGANLFHSFGTFHLGTGDTARFTTTDSFSNVISRVTGGSASQINGILQLLPGAGAPNFFFINPAGVTFGAGASVNVPAAFYVSTAHYLKFSNGDKFYADTSNASTFSSAAPEAFGFLGPLNSRGLVTVTDTIKLGTGNSAFQIIAGDVAIEKSAIVLNQAGDIRVVAIGSAADDVKMSGTVASASGNLTVTGADMSALDLFASQGRYGGGLGTDGGGNVSVSAKDITISSLRRTAPDNVRAGSDIYTAASGSQSAGNIDVLATGNLTIDGYLVTISSATQNNPQFPQINTGAAGSMNIHVLGELTLKNGSLMSTFTNSPGNAGAITVDAGSIAILTRDTRISSNTNSVGNAGSITVNTGSLTIDGQICCDNNTGITSVTSFPLGQYFPHGASPQVFGNSGNVKVTVTGAATLSNGGVITADTFSSGDGGTVTVAAQSLSLNNSMIRSIQNNVTRKSANGPGGSAGAVSVTADTLVLDTGFVLSDTYGLGNAGAVNVNAGTLTMLHSSAISSTADQLQDYISTGNAGSVNVAVTGPLSIKSGSQISSSTYTSGAGGTVTVSAGSLLIDGQATPVNGVTGITSQATIKNPLKLHPDLSANDYHPTGDAGSVQVAVSGAASISNGGVISSSTVALGKAGAVTVNAGTLTLDGAGSAISSDTTGQFGGGNNAGNVTVNATSLSVQSGGAISSSTSGQANAGTVTVSAGSLSVDAGRIVSEANANPIPFPGSSIGNAGDVQVSVADAASITNGGVISSSSSGVGVFSGVAGKVTVDAGTLTVDGAGSSISAAANLGSYGQAGNVSIKATDSIALTNGATFSIQNNALPVDPGAMQATELSVAAPSLTVDNASITASTTGSVKASNIVINPAQAGSVTIKNGGAITSDTSAGHYSVNNAGTLTVNATSLVVESGGVISSSTPGSANGGAVTVNADSLSVNAGQIVSLAQAGTDIGNAGEVKVLVTNAASITNGGVISSSSWGRNESWFSGAAGKVTVDAGTLTVDGAGSGISAAANVGSVGQTGEVTITARNGITLSNGATFSIKNDVTWQGSTFPPPPAQLSITASQLTVDGASITAATSGNLAASNIEINKGAPGAITVKGAGRITSDTSGTGSAGTVTVNATSLSVESGGRITSSTSGSGNAGTVKVNAGTLKVDGAGSAISAEAEGTSLGQTGSVTITATDSVTLSGGGKLSVENDATLAGLTSPTLLSVSAPTITLDGGNITAATSGSVAASSIEVSATALTLANTAKLVSKITSDTSGSGNAGSVSVAADTLKVLGGSVISSSTSGGGAAGTVTVNAGTLTVQGTGSSVSAAASNTSSGQTGDVTVAATNSITLSGGGKLSVENDATTAGLTSPTLLSVSAPTITLDGGSISAATSGSVAASGIEVSATVLTLANTANLISKITSDTSGSGDAGSVSVAADTLKVLGGSVISSSTSAGGAAGTVTVNAGTLTVQGTGSSISAAASSTSSGQTGSVTVRADSSITLSGGGKLSVENDATTAGSASPTLLSVSAPTITLDGGSITAATSGSVAASIIEVSATALTLANTENLVSKITSDTSDSGDAGSLSVAADTLKVLGGSVISSSTSGGGAAGTVTVNAGTLTVDGTGSMITAAAKQNSSGQTGNVTVSASESITLSNGGTLSIANDATVANPSALTPTLLSVSAPTITMQNASITAASTGNVAASAININYETQLFIDPSFVTTSAFEGNGGSIVIQGNGPMILDHSMISTSVTGPTNGNAGNILISVPVLILNTGFIQANTAAALASGGDVTILAGSVIPSGGAIIVGGFTPLTFNPNIANFNVIQAVAPSGLSGNIQVTAPSLDISGVLTALSGNVLSSAGVGRSPCAPSGGSSLAQTGRGGMPVSSSDMLTVESSTSDAGPAAPRGPGARSGTSPIVLAQCQ